MGRPATGHKLTYVHGITITNYKKFLGYHFSHFYHSMKLNQNKWRFDLYLFSKVKCEEPGEEPFHIIEEYYDLDNFRETWGKGIHIIMIDFKDKN